MKARFEQMNKTVNQLKETNEDNLEGLAHLNKQAQSVGKVHDDMTSSMISRRTSSPPDSTLSKLNSTLPTPEQTQASAQKGVLAAEAAALFIVALAIVDDEISPQYTRMTIMMKTIDTAKTKVTMAF
ncbi:hypothetical protein KCU99_g2713, partial [Aureobasidium melanogenum]